MEKTINIFGDSITWGACDYENGGWAERLRLATDDETTIYNLGIPGDDTRGILSRMEGEILARNPGCLIFAIGINDSKFLKLKNNNNVPFEEFIRNINAIIEKAKKFTNDIIFIGLTNIHEAGVEYWDDDLHFDSKTIMKYDEAIEEISKEQKVKYIKLYGLLENSDFEDGLHPNTVGHNKIFEKINKLIIKK